MHQKILQLPWQVITGCVPFSHIRVDVAVMVQVIAGHRPDRLPSGFSNQLWKLLETTWHEEQVSQPSKRPRIPTIIDQLDKDAHQWQKSIQLPSPVQMGAHIVKTCQTTGAFESTHRSTITHQGRPSHPPHQADPRQTVQHHPVKVRIADRLQRFLRKPLGFSLGLSPGV